MKRLTLTRKSEAMKRLTLHRIASSLHRFIASSAQLCFLVMTITYLSVMFNIH
jgi:hypothetical protein